MKHYIKITFSALLMMVSFTSLAQQMSKPEVPEHYRNNTVVDTNNIADIQWKSFFEQTDLVQLIDEALAKNNDLQIAEKNVAIANLQFKQAKWGNVPQLNAAVTATSTRLSDNSLNGISTNQFLGKSHIEDYTGGLNLAWEADIWGKIRNRWRKL